MIQLSPRVNLLLYSLLLILTPFILLKNYLQELIGTLSNAHISIGNIILPYSLIIVAALIVFLVIKTQKHLHKRIVLCWIAVAIFWFIGRQTSDYYLNHEFYDLQSNWHYIAYGLYVLVAYNSLNHKYPQKAKLIWIIYLQALFISSIDEIIQIFLSNRVFDMSDIAKDLWGTMAGIVLIFIGYKNSEIFKKPFKISELKLLGYFTNPWSTIVLLTIWSYLFLVVSSLLSEAKYIPNIIIISITLFLFVFLAIHKSYTKTGKRFILIALGTLLMILSISFAFNYKENINLKSPGLVVYKGLPLPYFDIMFFEDGGFRFVDKKTNFTQSDILHFFKKTSNILLIGTDNLASGKKGFPENLESQFMYNIKKKKVIQVIILPTAKACSTYNRLKKEGKEVTFVLHNTL